jgi:hypothetical protein
MTDRELMQQALAALEWNLTVIEDYGDKEQLQIQHKAINVLRDRLAQTEQGPVAWMYVNQDGECEQIEYEVPPNDPSVTPLYAAPRQWVGLTEEEVKECFKITPDLFLPWHIYARIEAKLKEKNT